MGLTLAIGALLWQAALAPSDTVSLTAGAAVELARTANPSLAAERARARAAANGSRLASPAFLPSLRLEVNGVRTTDPVAVFGLKLRQGVFGQGDFATDALNDPDPFGGWAASATIEQPILIAEGLYGHAAAGRAAQASEAAAARAAGATVFAVNRAYWAAKLAQARVASLDVTLTALRAHTDRAAEMHRQGMVTGLDARLARVRASEFEVLRLQAAAEAANASSQLKAILALPESIVLVLADSLDSAGTLLCDDCDTALRGDVRATALGAEATELAVKRAWATQLPSLFAFGSVAHHSDASPWGRGSGDWTIGLGLRWNILRGLAGPGEVGRAKAERDAALAQSEAVRLQAVVEAVSARRLWETARARVAVAETAVAEADSTLAQAELRYRTGVSTITELLDVQTAVTNAELNLLAARHDLIVAAAAVEFAYGVNDS